ncbi:MAG: CYTH domain-containing protein [Prevotella sp.]|jgi:CYTH domain-containing protein|nr:CYTH domain-containing protein [Prevotella sp.]
MLEIERKFLVKGEFKPLAYKCDRIRQAYISNKPTVRVRQKGDKAYLTIKGKSSEDGLSRFEWEKEITLPDLEELLTLCDPLDRIDKLRYYVDYKGFIYEVDEFRGRNEGLIVAELELPTVDAPYEKPDWLGEEVTGDRKYNNSQLAKHPYTEW